MYSFKEAGSTMKFLVLIAIFMATTNCVPIDRGSQKFDRRSKAIGDINGSVKGEYTYVDSQGFTHEVKYEAGPQIGFKIREDKIIQEPTTTTTTSRPVQHIIPFIEADETIRVHHLRNEVPATVHRTTVPDIVHSQEPPPIRSSRKSHEFPSPSLSPTATIFAPRNPTLHPIKLQNRPVQQLEQKPFEIHSQHHIDFSGLDETVKVHHLRNEVPANVHKTIVPDIVHSESPPPIRSRRIRDVTNYRLDGRISGLTPEIAANIEAQNAYMQALNLLLPQIQQVVREQGEIIIPVHHVHHVHKLGHVQASAPQISVHSIRVTDGQHGLNIEHVPLYIQRRNQQNSIRRKLHSSCSVSKRDVSDVLKEAVSERRNVLSGRGATGGRRLEETVIEKGKSGGRVGSVGISPRSVSENRVVAEGKRSENGRAALEENREYRKAQVRKFPLASDVKLIEGYTPEVWEARRSHLANYEAIRAVLPDLKDEDYK